MIKIENLNFTYSNGTTALKNITIEFPPEHILAVLGESGSGKTTLLRCIGKFLKPDTGNITLDGKDIFELKELEFRKAIGIVFQRLYLFPHLTVLENMTLAPEKVLKIDKSEAESEAMDMLERLGIAELHESYPAQISGGQAQRVAIARSLMLKPQYLLLDEPTSALDINTTEDFGKWLLDLRADTTFIIVTHDIPFAGNIASSGVLLSQGVIQAEGKIDSILKNLQNM